MVSNSSKLRSGGADLFQKFVFDMVRKVADI